MPKKKPAKNGDKSHKKHDKPKKPRPPREDGSRALTACERNKRISFDQLKLWEPITTAYIRGDSISKIARDNNVEPGKVYTVIARCKQEWKTLAAQNYEEQLATRLAELEEIKRESWKGWESSRKNAVEVIEKNEPGGEGLDGEISITTKTKGQSGDPAFLGVLIKAIRTQAELTGLMRKYGDTKAEGEAISNQPQVVEIVITDKRDLDRIYSVDQFIEKRQVIDVEAVAAKVQKEQEGGTMTHGDESGA